MAKTPAEIRSLARAHTASAIKVLVGIMLQAKAPPAARVSAANALLDRGWGRPALSMAVIGDPDSPVIFDIRLGDGLRTVNGDPAPVVIEHDQAGSDPNGAD